MSRSLLESAFGDKSMESEGVRTEQKEGLGCDVVKGLSWPHQGTLELGWPFWVTPLEASGPGLWTPHERITGCGLTLQPWRLPSMQDHWWLDSWQWLATSTPGHVSPLILMENICLAHYHLQHTNCLWLMAPHSSTLAWRIPWTEEPGGLQSVG